ncbi:MAG: hypothetical protein Tsb0020_27050 [Haliangiales bacterium]
MSLTRIAISLIFASVAVTTTSVSAIAQESDEPARLDRFLSDKVVEGDEMIVQGSITSSTLVASELGETVPAGNTNIDNASPATRLYTDLRARLGIQNLSAGVDLRADARVRITPPCDFQTQNGRSRGLDNADDTDCRVQSGTYGDNEYEIRELYVDSDMGDLKLYGGRQVVPEIAAVRIDGVRAEYQLSGNWSVIGFGGLHPSRISRSVLDDYRATTNDEGDGVVVLPTTLGGGASYRYDGYFGSLGAYGIFPIVNDDMAMDTSAADTLHTYVTSNGYWRPSAMLDIYHFASIDVSPSERDNISDRFSNVSLGLNLQPVRDLRLTVGLHQFSTDTLDELEQYRLEQRSGNDAVQNNVDALRVASQSARLGASLALMERRFEVSTSFQVRRRPSQTVASLAPSNSGLDTPDALSGEVGIAVVDRRSLAGLRIGASVHNGFGLYDLGLGDNSYGRSNYLVGRLNVSRALLTGRLLLDADVSYLHAEDSGYNGCNLVTGDALQCFGTTTVDTVSAGTTVFYRILPAVYAMLTVNGALVSFTPGETAQDPNTSYSNTQLAGFLRAAYRF